MISKEIVLDTAQYIFLVQNVMAREQSKNCEGNNKSEVGDERKDMAYDCLWIKYGDMDIVDL